MHGVACLEPASYLMQAPDVMTMCAQTSHLRDSCGSPCEVVIASEFCCAKGTLCIDCTRLERCPRARGHMGMQSAEAEPV